MNKLIRLCLLVLAFAGVGGHVKGQALIGATNSTITESFTLGNGTFPTGWTVGGAASGTYVNQASGSFSMTSGAAYVFNGGGNGSIGVLNSSGYTAPKVISVTYKNNQATTITSLAVTWNYKKYRSGTRGFDLVFSSGAGSVTDVSTTPAIVTANTYSFAADANITTYAAFNTTLATIARGATITGLSLAQNATITLNWTITGNPAGSTNGQALAIDDFTLIANPLYAPTVTSPTATSVGITTATLGGNVTSNGNNTITEYGVVVSTSVSTPTTASNNGKFFVSGAPTINTPFTVSATGLTAATLYNYRPYAINSTGTSYGTASTFTLFKAAPTQTNLTFSGISNAGATVSMSGTYDGVLVYVSNTNSFSSVPTNNAAPPAAGTTAYNNTTQGEQLVYSGSGSSFNVSGLGLGTQYYVKAYAYNNTASNWQYATGAGTNNVGNFTTTSTSAPTVSSTTTANTITTTSFASGGNISGNGGGTISERGIVASTSANPTTASPLIYTENSGPYSTGSFTGSISGLTAGTTYFYRSYGINQYGTAYGPELSFATLKLAPTTQATSVVASAIASTTTTLSWTRGNGDGCIVKIKNVNSIANPTNGVDPSTGVSAAYTGSGEQVVYNGTGTTVNLTGLIEGDQYFVQVFEYNNSGTNAVYFTSTATNNPNNFTTTGNFLSAGANNVAVTENFNGISTSGLTMPSAWRIGTQTGTPVYTSGSTAIGTFAASGSPSGGGIYLWGTGVGTEYAVGTLTTGSFISPNNFMVKLKNTTGTTLSRFSISVDAERYKQNTTAATVKIQYSTDGTNWTDITGATTSFSTTDGTSFTYSSPTTQNITANQTGLSIVSGGIFYLNFVLNTGGSNGQGISIDNFSFVANPTSVPTLTTTTPVTVIGTTSATLGGNISANGNDPITEYGVVLSTTTTTPTTLAFDSKVSVSGAISGAFSLSAIGITAGQLYNYRAYATNNTGTAYGASSTFTTYKAAPSAQADLTFTGITNAGATINISGTYDGVLVYIDNADNGFATPTNNTAPGTGNASYSGGEQLVYSGSGTNFVVSGLSLSTTYYIRAYAYNNSGLFTLYNTGSGTNNQGDFTTRATSVPTVNLTTTANTLTSTSFASGGNVSSTGNSTITERGIVAALTTAPTTASSLKYTETGSFGTGSFTGSVSGLAVNTAYFYRSYAVNVDGTSYGPELSVTTLKNAPTTQATALVFSAITTSTATLTWTRGNGDGCIVKIKNANSIATPTNGTNPSTGVSAAYSGSGEQVVYNGTGTTVNVTGLVEGDTYYVQVFEYNNSGTNAAYNTANGAANNPRNFTTTITSIVVSAVNIAVTENFDAMSTTTRTFPTGWVIADRTSTPLYTSGVATLGNYAGSGAPSSGGTYLWGNAAASPTDLAVGAMTSGSYASPNNVLVKLKNTSGSTITRFAVSIDAKRYRINTAAASVTVQYSTNGTTWTTITGATTSFTTGTSAYNFTTGTVQNITAIQTGVSIANSGLLYLNFLVNTTGASSQGIGVDNFSFTANPTYAPTLTTTTPATNVLYTTATVGGNISDNGFDAVTEYGVVLSTSVTTPTTSSNDGKFFVSGATSGAYTVNATGLTAGTLYNYRAYATNNTGTSYGTASTFTLYKAAPTTATDLAFSTTCSTGTITLSNGNGEGRVVYISTGSNNFPTLTNGNAAPTSANTVYAGSGAQLVYSGSGSSVVVTGLSQSTNYYVRSFEYNNTGSFTQYYTATGTNNGDGGTMATNNIATPTISVTAGSLSACYGNSVTLTAPAGFSYLWSTGDTTRSISTIEFDSYTVQTISGTCTSAVSAAAVFAQAPGCTNTWTGSGTWSSAPGNWTSNAAPTQFSTAVVNDGVATLNGNVSVRNLTINSGASVVINSGDTLQVYGNLSNSGSISGNGYVKLRGTTAQTISGATTVKNLAISNNAGVTVSNPLRVTGTLMLETGVLASGGNLTLGATATTNAVVVNKSGSVSGSANVEAFINGVISSRVARHVSSPVVAGSYTDLTANDASPVVERWVETAYTGTTGSAWQSFTGPTMTVGTGYSYRSIGDRAVTLKGVLNNGNYNIPLTRTGANGWNLIGNPYPSALDWNKVTADASYPTTVNVSTAYFRWISTSANSGSWVPFVNGFGAAGNIVPVMGAVLVRTYQNSSITLKNAHRVTTPNAGSLYRVASDDRAAVTLNLENPANNLSDQVIVYFQEGASTTFNGGFDANRMGHNVAGKPSVFASLSGTSYAIKGLPLLTEGETRVVPISITVPSSGYFNFNATSLVNVDGLSVTLIDSDQNTEVDLKTNPEYLFGSVQGSTGNRFALRFGRNTSVTSTNSTITKFSSIVAPNPSSNGSVTVAYHNPENVVAMACQITNMVGQTVFNNTFELQNQGSIQINTSSLAKGMYLMTIKTGTQISTERLVIE